MIPYNQWFYCNIDELIERDGNKMLDLRTYTHPFLCNPIGYLLDFQKTFTLLKIINNGVSLDNVYEIFKYNELYSMLM